MDFATRIVTYIEYRLPGDESSFVPVTVWIDHEADTAKVQLDDGPYSIADNPGALAAMDCFIKLLEYQLPRRKYYPQGADDPDAMYLALVAPF